MRDKNDRDNIITISPGNHKLGDITSISLPVDKTCRKNAPCKKVCYAKHGKMMYDNVKKAYEKNYRIYMQDSNEYFHQIRKYIMQYDPKYFRFHVAGDIPNRLYLQHIFGLAIYYSSTNFSLYTKKYMLVNRYLDIREEGETYRLLNNLNIMFSHWTGVDITGINRHNLPIAYYCPKGEDAEKYSEKYNAKICPGSCQDCKYCYERENKENGKYGNVVFRHH